METNTATTPKPVSARSHPAGYFRPKRKVVDPLRAALAAASKEAERAHHRVAAQRAGIERQRTSVREAERAVNAAGEAVKKAAQEHASAIAVAAAGNTAPPASGVRAARQAVVDAGDELEAAKAALDQLKADLPGLIENARYADTMVESAISSILAPQAEWVLERARSVQKLFAPLRAVLFSLFADTPAKATSSEYPAAQEAQRPLSEVRAQVTAFFEQVRAAPPAVNPWKEARQALRSNPHATLPPFAPLSPHDETENEASGSKVHAAD